MTPFELIRVQVRPALPAPCLVAFDRTGRALLMSDFPARYAPQDAQRAVDALMQLGFACCIENGKAFLDWTPDACAQWLHSLPAGPLPPPHDKTFGLWGVCRALLRHAPGAPDADTFNRAVFLMQQKDIPALTRHLGAALAAALRTKQAPPTGLAHLVIATNLLNENDR